MTLAFGDFAVTVTNAQEAARWWKEKLGFSVYTVGAPGGHAVTVAPPGERFLLHLCEGFEPVDPGNTGISFVTDEIEAQVGRMVAAGVQFPEPLAPGGRGAKFADPDGNVFWLIGAPTTFIREVTALRAGGEAEPPPTLAKRRRTRRT